MTMRKYAVIPAFSEEETIASVVENLISYVDHVVVIDDCSYDRTSERASAAGAEVLINDRNLGYEKSLFKGIQHAINGLASSV